MAFAAIEETRKVSFDDLLSESVGVGDEGSIEGLVTVPEEFEMHSEPLPFLPEMENDGASSLETPHLYSEFDPPQNPEPMRRHRKYATITATPDYCRIYSSYNWRRVSVEPTSCGNSSSSNSSKRGREGPEWDYDGRPSSKPGSFHGMLTRFASSMRRSAESRSTILRHHAALSEAIDLEKGVEETLQNETRITMLDMVNQELGHGKFGETGRKGREAEEKEMM